MSGTRFSFSSEETETSTLNLGDFRKLDRKTKDEWSIQIFEELLRRSDEVEGSLQTVREEQDKIKLEQRESSNRSIETLAIFAALFTFISAEVQIGGAPVPFISAVGYSILILGGLALFLFILDAMISRESGNKEKRDRSRNYVFLGVIIALLLGGGGAIYLGVAQKEENYPSRAEVTAQIASTTQTVMHEFKSCIHTNGLWYCVNEK